MRPTVITLASALAIAALALTVGDALAQQAECIPPAQLRTVSDQRNAAQDQLAAIVAQATAEIERLKRELEAAKKPPKETPGK
jgi:Skp family chaperone for outer membrane proteins